MTLDYFCANVLFDNILLTFYQRKGDERAVRTAYVRIPIFKIKATESIVVSKDEPP